MGRHKMDVELMKFRAKRYHYLSTLFRDEMPLELISAMQKDEFLEGLNESVKGCGFIDLISGAEVMTSYLKRDNAERLHKELGYDYADLFLNAGPNPVFPYESVQVSKEPVVMQTPVLDLRKFFRKAGVSKSPDYKDLEEHIAVHMEFFRYLLEKGKRDLYKEFFKNKYMNWVPSFCDQLAVSARTGF